MSYAVAGYLITAVVLIIYAVRLILRERALTRTLPPSEKTWR